MYYCVMSQHTMTTFFNAIGTYILGPCYNSLQGREFKCEFRFFSSDINHCSQAQN